MRRAILSHIWNLPSRDIDKESCYYVSFLDLTPDNNKEACYSVSYLDFTPKDNKQACYSVSYLEFNL